MNYLLTEKDKEKLIKVLNLTSSSNDNEAIAALRVAKQILAKSDVEWKDLVFGFVILSNRSEIEIKEAYDEGYRQGVTRGRREGRRNTHGYDEGFKKGQEFGFTMGYAKGFQEKIDDVRKEVDEEVEKEETKRYKPIHYDITNPPINDRKKIDKLFTRLSSIDPNQCGFDVFFASVKSFYERRGYISTKQYNRLKDIYEENC